MKKCLGALCALAVFGVLLAGPLVLAVRAAQSTQNQVRCVVEMGCDPVTSESYDERAGG